MTKVFSQADMFWGMSIDFVKAVTDLAVHISCREGDRLFEIGDPADRFYILLKGNVIMERGKDKLYTAQQAGEIFGWSALIRQGDYFATVICEAPTVTLRFNCEAVCHLLEQHADSAAIFYKQLARALGSRLLTAYDMIE